MSKKQEEPPVYEVVSIIEKPHLCTWKENEGMRGYGTAKYKVLITDEDANYRMVSCLNEDDLTETAELGFDEADEGYVPYEYDEVGVKTFEEIVMYEYKVNESTFLDAFDHAIDTIRESDIAITPELAEYFRLADGLKVKNLAAIWPRRMKERMHIEDIAEREVRNSINWHIKHPDDKFDDK